MPSETSKFNGTYAGLVVDTKDPSMVGRIKARVPILHGISGSAGGIVEDKNIPWALPVGMPAGGSQQSGGISWLPIKGDQVWVRFLDGDLDKPIWEWGNQNVPQSKAYGQLALHSYQGSGLPTSRSASTRFSHWWELLPQGHDIWTKSGYHFEVNDGNGSTPSGYFSWTTAAGYIHKLDDSLKLMSTYVPKVELACETKSVSASKSIEVSTPTLGLNFGSIKLGGSYSGFNIDAASLSSKGLSGQFNSLALSMSGAFIISASGFSISSGGLSFNRSSNTASTSGPTGFSVTGDTIGIGYNANDPLVRMSDLVKALQSVKEVFDKHVHTGVSGGRGTSSIPAQKAVYLASGSGKVSAEPASSVTKSVD